MQQTLQYTLRYMTRRPSLPQGLSTECFTTHSPEVFGEECESISEPGYQSIRCWIAAGMIYDSYLEVLKHLQAIKHHPKLAKNSPAIDFTSCLIGLEVQHAGNSTPNQVPTGPIVILHCEHVKYREKAVEIIRKQPFWQSFASANFGFQIIHRPKPPLLVTMLSQRARGRICRVFTAPNKDHRAPMLLFDENDSPLCATVSGIIELNNSRYILSVGHIIDPAPHQDDSIDTTTYPDNKSFPELYDDDSITPISSDEEDEGSRDVIGLAGRLLGVRQIPSDYVPTAYESTVFLTSVDFPDSVCDWSLLIADHNWPVESFVPHLLTQPGPKGGNDLEVFTAQEIFEHAQSGTYHVLIHTSSSDIITGTLIHYPRSFSAAGTSRFIQLCAVRTSKPLRIGDCGSRVYSAPTQWLGHIVAIEPETDIAFFVDAASILNEIDSRIKFSQNLEVASLQQKSADKSQAHLLSAGKHSVTLQGADKQDILQGERRTIELQTSAKWWLGQPTDIIENVVFTRHRRPAEGKPQETPRMCNPCRAFNTKCDGKLPCDACRMEKRLKMPCIYTTEAIQLEQVISEMPYRADKEELSSPTRSAAKDEILPSEDTTSLRATNIVEKPYSDQSKLAEAEKMYVRALAGYENALGEEHTSTLDTVNHLGNLYPKQGKLVEAEQMYVRALAGYEKALGMEHTLTLYTVNHLGNLYSAQGKLAEAEKMYVRALAGFEKALGEEHTSTLYTVNNLGVLYRDQGRLAEAEQMYVRALAGKEKALGEEHTSTLYTVNNLGVLYSAQGMLAEAEKMYVRALAGYEKALGEEHTSTLYTVNNLGVLYSAQGMPAEAEKMYVRALAGFKKALGEEHTSTLYTVNNLGVLYRDQGRLAEAEQMYVRALAGYEKALGEEHTSTLYTVNNLGVLYRDQGKLAEAEQMYVRALAGYEKALGEEHISTLYTVNNLGVLYRDQGKLAEAEQMYVRALAGKEKALGKEYTSTLDTVNHLGNLYSEQGKLAEAEQMYVRALAGYEKALGAEHTSTLYTVNNLGVLYRDQGKLAEAEQVYVRALVGKEKVLGEEHTSALQTVNNLGILYSEQGKLAEAEQMYVRALAGFEKALGEEHISTLYTVNNLGVLYRDQGKLAEAEQMYVRALVGKEKALGAEHTLTLDTVNNLGVLSRNQGRLAEAEQMYVRALAGYEKALGMEHTSALQTVNNLGNLYSAQGKLAEAERMYVRALAGFEKALGVEHISTLYTVCNLGLLYRVQGKLLAAEQHLKRAAIGIRQVLGTDHPNTKRVLEILQQLNLAMTTS